MSVALTGLDELRRTLTSLKDKGVKKAAKAGINAGLQPILSAIRGEVNSAPISPELKKEVRATLGKRLQKVSDDYLGKVGFGVGKPSAGKKAKAATRHGDKGGVGISASNVHWFVLGTTERTLANPVRMAFPGEDNGGKPGDKFRTITQTGKIAPVLAGMVGRAAESVEDQITKAAAIKISAVLASEAAKH